MKLTFKELLPAITAAIIAINLSASITIPLSKEEPAVALSEKQTETESWILIASDVTATVYNAGPSQCNRDYTHTASMFRIEKDKISSYRIIAMERTMMTEYGISFGDIVRIEGTGTYDGIWQVQDLMNKRFKGQHKIDFLVPNDVRYGKWTGISLYRPGNNHTLANNLIR